MPTPRIVFTLLLLRVLVVVLFAWLQKVLEVSNTEHAQTNVQVKLTRLVTLHSLWPTKVDTGKWSSISPSLITVIQKVKPILIQVC